MKTSATVGREKVYGFLSDFVFKFAFGKPQNKRILIALLNALMQYEGDSVIDDLTILNPYSLAEFRRAKSGVLDVKVRDRRDRQFFIEAQVAPHEGFAGRVLFYLSRLFSEQLKKGQEYTALRTTTGLAILNFDLWSGPEGMYNVFRFRNTATGTDFSPLLEVRTIELSKYRARRSGEARTRFERWLDVLGFGPEYLDGRKQLPDSPETEEEMAMAIEQLKRANADRRLRNLLEAEERRDRAIAQEFATARRQGEAEGREKGLAEGLAEGRAEGRAAGRAEGRSEGEAAGRSDLIRKMASNGASPQQIASLTSLTIEEVNNALENVSSTR